MGRGHRATYGAVAGHLGLDLADPSTRFDLALLLVDKVGDALDLAHGFLKQRMVRMRGRGRSKHLLWHAQRSGSR